MLFSLLFNRYCEKIGLKNYLRRLLPAMIIAFIVFLGLWGFYEFKTFSFKEQGIKIFLSKIGYTLIFSYITTMAVPAVEDFIACRRNEIRPFFIDVHTGAAYTKISAFELMLWTIRFSLIWAFSMTLVYSLPVTLIVSKVRKIKNKTSDEVTENEEA